MRILIIAGSRVGGTKISEWLSYELGIECIHEPFAHWRSGDGSKVRYESRILRGNENGMIVKIFPGSEWEALKDKEWDLIIGLSRDNLRETAESMVRAESSGVWHNEYEMDGDWIEKNESLIEDGIQRVKEWRDRILNNDRIGLQITYEGIYYTKEDRDKLKTRLGISEWRFDSMLDTEYRYRKEAIKPKSKTLI